MRPYTLRILRCARCAATFVLVTALALAGPPTAVARVGDPFRTFLGMNATRQSGPTRYETAVEIAEAAYPLGSDAVVITTGLNFPDALSGAALASALRAPILLTKPDALPPAVAAEIEHLDPGKAVILGSEDVVSGDIETWLRARIPVVERYGGENRYETATLVAREVEQEYLGIPGQTAIITVGNAFPDALAGSPLSAIKGWPVLLVNQNSIPPATAAALADLDIRRTIVLGDESAISAAVAAQLPAVTRLGGDTRYDTMAEISEYMRGLGLPDEYVSVATGRDFPDALAGSVLTAQYGGVLLLSTPDTISPQADAELFFYASDHNVLFEAYGGTDVISDAVLNVVWGWGV